MCLFFKSDDLSHTEPEWRFAEMKPLLLLVELTLFRYVRIFPIKLCDIRLLFFKGTRITDYLQNQQFIYSYVKIITIHLQRMFVQWPGLWEINTFQTAHGTVCLLTVMSLWLYSATFCFDVTFYGPVNNIGASSWDYGTYRIGNRRRLRRAVSPKPSLFAHMKYGNRRRVRPKISPLDGCTCAFEEWGYGGRKVP